MPAKASKCDVCGKPMVASHHLVRGVTTWCCRECRRFRLEGDRPYFGAGPDGMRALRARAAELVGRARQEAWEEKRFRQMMESDGDDPRWTNFTV